MALKSDAKFKGTLTRGLKNDVRIWLIFIWAVESLAVMRGWESFTWNRGETTNVEMWERGYNGEERWEILKISLHSWQKGASPLFYEDPPYIAFPVFSSFVYPPPHTYLSPPTLIPTWFNWYPDSISHTHKHTNTQSTVMCQQTDTLI